MLTLEKLDLEFAWHWSLKTTSAINRSSNTILSHCLTQDSSKLNQYRLQYSQLMATELLTPLHPFLLALTIFPEM